MFRLRRTSIPCRIQDDFYFSFNFNTEGYLLKTLSLCVSVCLSISYSIVAGKLNKIQTLHTKCTHFPRNKKVYYNLNHLLIPDIQIFCGVGNKKRFSYYGVFNILVKNCNPINNICLLNDRVDS